MRKIKRRLKPYYQNDWGKLYLGECSKVLGQLKTKVDLVVTSPPYDKLRNYKGFDFNFKAIAKGLRDILKPGGVLVWVVADQTIGGSETGTSFRHALYFKKIGLRLHDTMIYRKNARLALSQPRYSDEFEYMFILSNGKPKTFNPIKVKTKFFAENKSVPVTVKGNTTSGDGRMVASQKKRVQKRKYKKISNIWKYNVGSNAASDKIAYKHPAIFPDQLAYDHIITWTNPGDIVLDPMAGSGTTPKMAQILKRKWIAIELSKQYVDEVTIERIKLIKNQDLLFRGNLVRNLEDNKCLELF